MILLFSVVSQSLSLFCSVSVKNLNIFPWNHILIVIYVPQDQQVPYTSYIFSHYYKSVFIYESCVLCYKNANS